MNGADFGFGALEKAFVILCALAPFGAWKVVEIVIWLFQNVTIGIKP